MSAIKIYEQLTAAQCENIAESFVRVMHAQVVGSASAAETGKALSDLWYGVLSATGVEVRARKQSRIDTRHRQRLVKFGDQVLPMGVLADRAGCTVEAMRQRLRRMSPEKAVALGAGREYARLRIKPTGA